ncbi:energy-coupling factor ABC transporter permease [Dermacoccaceae bacterium W4C1]
MHVPDGFIDLPTSAATGVVAAAGVALALRKAAGEIRESGPALPGLVAAFVFAVQMVNFPVGAGTSGHLLGGALAAALVGPWTAVLCLSVVLAVQALLFADGGLTALGTNITLMALVTVLVAYPVMRALVAVLPARRGSVIGAVATGALLAVPVSALVFTGIYAVGGSVDIAVARVAAAMLGWHVLIGVGEAIISGAVVAAVLATRPDLVYIARHLPRELVIVGADGQARTVTADRPVGAPVPVGRRAAGALLAAAVVVAGGLSYLASAHPDGLEYVGEQLGFSGEDSAVSGSPVADYAVAGLSNGLLAGGLAGILGVLVTVAAGYLVARGIWWRG